MSKNAKVHTELKLLRANIRRQRCDIKMTQEKMAELTDLNIRTIQKIEAGEINILVTTLRRIHQALGCPWDRLL
ncbi:MAG: helix-turn-helix transcriptional regulator [Verrucomicrobiota bacterium]|nr:helix-turn-helix transcriptional regulator [Verrucomicrobiota bacterium]